MSAIITGNNNDSSTPPHQEPINTLSTSTSWIRKAVEWGNDRTGVTKVAIIAVKIILAIALVIAAVKIPMLLIPAALVARRDFLVTQGQNPTIGALVIDEAVLTPLIAQGAGVPLPILPLPALVEKNVTPSCAETLAEAPAKNYSLRDINSQVFGPTRYFVYGGFLPLPMLGFYSSTYPLARTPLLVELPDDNTSPEVQAILANLAPQLTAAQRNHLQNVQVVRTSMIHSHVPASTAAGGDLNVLLHGFAFPGADHTHANAHRQIVTRCVCIDSSIAAGTQHSIPFNQWGQLDQHIHNNACSPNNARFRILNNDQANFSVIAYNPIQNTLSISEHIVIGNTAKLAAIDTLIYGFANTCNDLVRDSVERSGGLRYLADHLV